MLKKVGIDEFVRFKNIDYKNCKFRDTKTLILQKSDIAADMASNQFKAQLGRFEEDLVTAKVYFLFYLLI